MRMSRVAKVTTGLLFVTWLIDYFDRLIMTIALPHVGAAFHLDHTQQGLIISAFFFAYAFSQLPGGILADRFGTRFMIAAAMIIWSLFTGLTAVAWGFAAMLVIRGLFGIGEGIFPGASIKAITERTKPHERMLANGIMLSSNNFGSAVAPLVAVPLVAAIGWRLSFGFSAIAGLVMLAVLLIWLPGRNHPDLATAPPGNSDRPRTDPAQYTSRQRKGPVWAILASPAIYLYVVMFFGLDIIGWGINTWMPSYLSEVRGLSISGSAILLAIPPTIGGITTMIGGRLTDRLGGRPRLVVAPAMAVGGAALLMMALSDSLTAFVIWECVGIGCFGLSFMPVMSVPLKTLNGRFTGSASGTINFGGQMAGVLAPVVMGFLVDRFSYTAAFMFPVAGALLTLVMALVVPQTPVHLAGRLRRNWRLEGGYSDVAQPTPTGVRR
uniref:Sugar phosphate permease n=1 Tax=Microlunatus soli TaxID=630515 RepID=A0A1H1RHQ6_9ACTN|nr:MFS transporter [Microlunatus soli]SDS35225.1 Sugar phosphate permease [Microlunatus soli]